MTEPFDPNAGMYTGAPSEELPFAKTPANVNMEFVQEAKQNMNMAAAKSAPRSLAQSAPPSAPPSEGRPVRDPGTATPSSSKSSRPATVAAPPGKKRKRTTTLRVTNANDYPGTSARPAAAVTPAPVPIPKIVPSTGNVLGLPAIKKRKRQAGKKQLNARVIPRSLDECDDADKELIRLREAGEEWKAIRDRWAEMTGEQTAISTLPNRYARLKSNFTVIKEEDNGHLIAAKREVEESFENQKWDLIARVVQEKGGENYAAVVLRRQYKKLMVSSGAVPPLGVQDPDFAIELPEDEGE